MAKKVRRSNVKDGVLLPLGNGFSLVKGDHPNKVDDVDIGPNNKNGLSVNNGEILQQKGNTLRVFSAEPMLGGASPVQLLYGGMAPDKVFAMQEQYKQANRIADDGTKYKKGGKIDYDDIANKYIAEYNAGKYTTKLSDEDENKFKAWYSRIPVKMYNQASNADDFEHGYDWRGYWLNEWKKDGGKTEWNKMSSSTKEKWHWPDTYKQPHHRTFSNESKYSINSQIGGTWNNDNFNPSEYNYLLEYALADKNGRQIIDRRKNKEFNYDDFVRFAKSHKQFNLTDNELKDIWSGFVSTKINPAALSYLVSSESKFDKNAKASSTSAKGLYQMTDVALKQLYGDEQGEIISKQYKDNKRSVKDQTFDLIKYIDKYNSSDTTYGLLKSKHLVPNVSETSIIPSVVWSSNITPSQKKLLVQNKSTMRDFINVLNNEYDSSMFGYNRNFKFGGRTNINSLGERPNAKYKKQMKNKRIKALYGLNGDEDNILLNPAIITANGRKIRELPRPSVSVPQLPKPRIFIPQVRRINAPEAISSSDVNFAQPFVDRYGTTINPDGSVASIKVPERQIGLSNPRPIAALTTTPKSSGLPAWGADLIGAGINTVGSLIAAGINQNAINSQKFTPRNAVLLNPVKLKTKININPQLGQMRETVAQINNSIRRNSASSRSVRSGIADTRFKGLSSMIGLYGDKENKETQLINQDRLNQQQIGIQNANRVMEANNYNIAGKDSLNNRKTMLTAQNWINPINVAGKSATDFLTRRDARIREANNLTIATLPYLKEFDSLSKDDFVKKHGRTIYDAIINGKSLIG